MLVAALSETAKIKIQQALDQCMHWHCSVPIEVKPVFKEVLSGGRSNTSVLVASGQQQFVVRLDGVNPQRLGLSRTAEWHVQLAAAKNGLAPRPVYFNPELGILVSEFFQQQTHELSEQQEIFQLARLLRAVHQLPPVKFRLLPLDRARRYLGLLHEQELPQEFQTLCEQLKNSSTPCLCHNDLLRANRLQGSGKLVAIDWEYAATGDPWFELAAICEGDSLDDAHCELLITHYLDCPPTPQQSARLESYRYLYCVLADMWERFTGY